jgi:3-oxoacyl-[acyl-carrier-protein] synthase III
VGSFVPKRIVSNERIAAAIPGWSPERIEEKLGIVERRFLWDFDTAQGKAIPPPDGEVYPGNNVDMCEVALKRALEGAGVGGDALDALFVVTCTPDRLNFNHDAMALHERLGCRPDAFSMVVDDGCGGTPYLIDFARKMMEGGAFRTVAIVASALTSPLINREVYTDEVVPAPGRRPLSALLTMYVFGDGASAVILRADERDGSAPPSGIVRSISGNGYEELVLRRAGGGMNLPYQGRARPAEHGFVVDGLQVARSYPRYMRRCIDEVTGGDRALLDEVKRFYFHQPNRRVLDRFAEEAGLPRDRIGCNVERRGNTSAAGMLTLLADDLEQGVVRLGSGELVMIAAVGANVHYGAQLVRL